VEGSGCQSVNQACLKKSVKSERIGTGEEDLGRKTAERSRKRKKDLFKNKELGRIS